MSPEQYLALPEDKPYLEYVDGVVLQKPMANLNHGQLAMELGFRIRTWMGDRPGHSIGAEVRAKLGDLPNYRLPDVSYWAPGRAAEDDSLPTLAIEIRSPSQTLGELREKCRFFRRNGVDACWIVDPESRTAELFELNRDGEVVPTEGTLSSTYLPGFALKLTELYAVLR
jgi:Uma2 family endonuclease